MSLPSSGVQTGQMPGRERPVQIITPADTVDIQEFTSDIESGVIHAFHRLLIDLRGDHAARGHLRLFKTSGACDRNAQADQASGQG